MKLTPSIIAFSLFSGSVLVGGNFYQNSNNNQNVSQLVYGNKKNSQVVNFLKTSKDLEVVNGEITILDFQISESNESLKNNQARKENLSKDKQKKDSKIEELEGKIRELIESLGLLNKQMGVYNSQASEIISSQNKFKEIVSNLKALRAKKILEKTTKEKRKIQEQINKLKKELEEQRLGWKGHVDDKKHTNKETNDKVSHKNKLEKEKETSETNLEKTQQYLKTTQDLIQELEESLRLYKKDLDGFTQQQKNLRTELKTYATEIVES